MGEDRIRYLLPVSGRWRWRPTRTMRAHGFALVNFGKELTAADKARAIALNDDWDKVRRGAKAKAATPADIAYPAGSVGAGYRRAMKLRAAERAAKGILRTKEQAKRDDWPRAWKWLGPVYGDQDPKTVTPEGLLTLRTKVAARVSATEAHRVIKVWRALWKKLEAFGFCTDKDGARTDPSLAFGNTAPDPRQAVWRHSEVLLLVDHALARAKPMPGLAALMAVVWDTMLSPGDARTLTPGQRAREGARQGARDAARQGARDAASEGARDAARQGTKDAAKDGAREGQREDQRESHDAMFFLDRAKTGRAAAGTLSPWSEAILASYLQGLGVELHANAPIFRTAGSGTGRKGGRRWLPQPYSTSKMDRDFRVIRGEVFGPHEHRQLADMRRSGAVEGDAGGASGSDMSNKMANTIGTSNRLRKTYTPVNVTSVRRFDEAREAGRKKMREPK